jgi:hypothetical protein
MCCHRGRTESRNPCRRSCHRLGRESRRARNRTPAARSAPAPSAARPPNRRPPAGFVAPDAPSRHVRRHGPRQCRRPRAASGRAGARPFVSPVGAADGAVVVGEKGDRRCAHRHIRRRVLRRCGEDAAESDLVLIEKLRVAQERGQLPVGSRIGRRSQKTQHNPAAGRDLKVEGAVADKTAPDRLKRCFCRLHLSSRRSPYPSNFGFRRIVLRHGKFCSNRRSGGACRLIILAQRL